MSKKRKLLNPDNAEGLKQAQQMARKVGAKEIAALTVSFVSLISIVTDFEPIVTSIQEIAEGEPNWIKFGFSIGGFVVAIILLGISIYLFGKDRKSFEEKSKINFYADTQYYQEVLNRIRKIDQDNTETRGKLVTVDYFCDPNIPFDEDWYLYNPDVNNFLQDDDKLNSIICVFSKYEYKIPNVCRHIVPFVLFNRIYGEKHFYNSDKLRLCSELDFAIPRSPEKIKIMNEQVENAKRIFGEDYCLREKDPVVYVNKTTQFNTMCTNDIALKKIRAIQYFDEEFNGDKLFIENELVSVLENGKYVSKKVDRFCRYNESAMSNQIGCSSVLITSDNKIVVRRQGSNAGSYYRMIVPSGSTSVNFASYADSKKKNNKAHTVYKDDDSLNAKEKKYISGGEHILDLKKTIIKCASDDLETKLHVRPDFVKVIGFLKVVFRGNLPDFSCLSYTKLTAQQVIYKATGKWLNKPSNDDISWAKSLNAKDDCEISTEVYSVEKLVEPISGAFKVFDLTSLESDAGLLNKFTVKPKNGEENMNDSISIQFHAILTFLKDNKELLSNFVKQAKEK